MTTNQDNPWLQAAEKIKTLLTKPAIGGIPDNESKHNAVPALNNGARFASPRKSSIFSPPVAFASAIIPAKAPRLVSTYTRMKNSTAKQPSEFYPERLAANPTRIYPACAILEYPIMRFTLVCTAATKFPNVIVSTAMIETIVINDMRLTCPSPPV